MQYDKTFKDEALRLSDEIGVKNAAAQLRIPYYTLYVFIYYNQMRVYTFNPDGLPPVVYRRLLENQFSQAA